MITRRIGTISVLGGLVGLGLVMQALGLGGVVLSAAWSGPLGTVSATGIDGTLLVIGLLIITAAIAYWLYGPTKKRVTRRKSKKNKKK